MSNSFSNWKDVVLEDVCNEITVGFVGSMAKEYIDEGIPFLRSQNVKPFRLDLSDVKFISHEFHQRLRKSALFPGDLVIVRTGYPGTSCVIPEGMSIANCADMVIVRTSDQVDAQYLSAIFNSSWGRASIHGRLVGVAQQHFNVSAAKRMSVRLPPIDIQSKISAIITNLNNLIENNRRRIQLLEEMARALYREWFVHFRFPGYEDVEMVDSKLGEIPEGWRMSTLGKECHLVIGQSPKSEYYNEDGEGLPFHQGVKDFGDFIPVHRMYCTIDKRVAEPDDILFSVRAPVGRINLADTRLIVGRGLHAIRQKGGNQVHLLFQLKNKFYKEDMMGSGTVYQAVTKSDMLNIELLVPTKTLVKDFEASVGIMVQLIIYLIKQNQNLSIIRNLLLPKLVSGRIDVSDLDIESPTDTHKTSK